MEAERSSPNSLHDSQPEGRDGLLVERDACGDLVIEDSRD